MESRRRIASGGGRAKVHRSDGTRILGYSADSMPPSIDNQRGADRADAPNFPRTDATVRLKRLGSL